MARTHDDDVTPELTGRDASTGEAETGDAGSGASPFGADRTGLPPPDDEVPETSREFEAAGEAHDITPDKIEPGFSDGRDEDDRRLTARPHEDVRPITPDLLPSDDEGAARGDEDAERRAEGDLPRGSDPRDVLPRR